MNTLMSATKAGRCFRMDALPVSTPRTEDGEPTTEVVGFTKPLHRFIRAEPKSIGVVMIFFGSSYFVTGIPMRLDISENSTSIYSSFWLGILFIACGILFIIAEQRLSKKMVTASLAMSIISIIGTLKAFLDFVHFLIRQRHHHYVHYPDEMYQMDNTTDPMREHPMDESHWHWEIYHMDQLCCMEGVWLVHSIAGAVILIVMAAFSRAALKSNKTQVTVIMHNQPSE